MKPAEPEKPKLNKEALASFKWLISETAVRAISQASFPFQNCINCTHFDEKNELCRLAKQRPPARIIAYGCKAYVDADVIPF